MKFTSSARAARSHVVRLGLILLILSAHTGCVDLLTAGFPGQTRVMVGDTITGTLGHSGEFDTFVVSSNSRIDVAAFIRAADQSAGLPHLRVKQFRSPRTTIASTVGAEPAAAFFARGSGAFVVDAEELVVEVAGDGVGNYVGEYQFQLVYLDPEPESAPSTLSLGTEIRETIFPPGDMDRYTFSGAGSPVEVVIVSTGFEGVTVEFAHNAEGTAFSTVAVNPGSVGVMVHLPASDETFHVRVTGRNGFTAFGDYRLAVLP